MREEEEKGQTVLSMSFYEEKQRHEKDLETRVSQGKNLGEGEMGEIAAV